MILPRLRDEPRFIGSRIAPQWSWGMGCCEPCGGGEPDPCGCDGGTAKAPGFEVTVSGLVDYGTGCLCTNYDGVTACLAYIGSCNWFFIGERSAASFDPDCGNGGFPPTWWLQAECSDDQPCSAILSFGYYAFNFGVIALKAYTCDSFSCTTGGTFTRSGLEDDPFSCQNWPDEIVVTPSEDCTSEPFEECQCTPKSDYKPVTSISGITDDDGTCVPALAICWEPYGEDDTDCRWIKEFTLPGSTATYAILNTFDSGNVTVRFYNSSDVEVALYQAPLTAFTCDGEGIALEHISSSDTWTWPTEFGTAFLTMHGADPCPDCTCDPATWTVSLDYDSNSYSWCIGANCSGTSIPAPIFGGGGDSLYIVVELGELPAIYARVTVYFLPSGGVVGVDGVPIGVYNFTSAMQFFACDGANSLDLAAGNAGECGSDVDEPGYTENLSATASMTPFTCSGTTTYTTPGTHVVCTQFGATYRHEGWAGGGSGRGGTAGSKNSGAGGSAYYYDDWVSDGSPLIYVIGAGGAASGTDGLDGTDTTVTIYGGATLLKVAHGKGAPNSTSPGDGGAVVDCIGDGGFAGGRGGTGSNNSDGAGGGSSAGTASAGVDGHGLDADGDSLGGVAPSGGGNGGNGGVGTNGSAGSAPGGGGGGSDNGFGGTSGAGGDGKLIVTCTPP